MSEEVRRRWTDGTSENETKVIRKLRDISKRSRVEASRASHNRPQEVKTEGTKQAKKEQKNKGARKDTLASTVEATMPREVEGQCTGGADRTSRGSRRQGEGGKVSRAGKVNAEDAKRA